MSSRLNISKIKNILSKNILSTRSKKIIFSLEESNALSVQIKNISEFKKNNTSIISGAFIMKGHRM